MWSCQGPLLVLSLRIGALFLSIWLFLHLLVVRFWKKVGGVASRYPACSGYTGLWSEPSSLGRCCPCGSCRSSLGRCRHPDPMLPSSASALLSSSSQSA